MQCPNKWRFIGLLGLLIFLNSSFEVLAQDENFSETPANLTEQSVVEKADSKSTDTAGLAAVDFMTMTLLPKETKEEIVAAVRNDLPKNNWSGRIGTQLYVVAARRIPQSSAQQQMRVTSARLVSNLAHSNLLKYKAVADYCATQGFANDIAIREVAFGRTGISFKGSVKDVLHQADVVGEYAIAYALAEEGSILAELKDAESSIEIRTEYGIALHRQMRLAMQDMNWAEAFQTWTSMKSLHLSSVTAQIDAIHCLIELERFSESVSLAKEWLAQHGETADVNLIERLADEMLGVHSAEGQQFATAAFSLVVNRLTTHRAGSFIEK